MIMLKVKELMERDEISRYKLQQMTNWNYKRVNAYYFNKVINININELDMLCNIFNCDVSDIIVHKK